MREGRRTGVNVVKEGGRIELSLDGVAVVVGDKVGENRSLIPPLRWTRHGGGSFLGITGDVERDLLLALALRAWCLVGEREERRRNLCRITEFIGINIE